MYKKYLKSLFDFIFALIALIFVSPFFVIISIVLIALYRDSPFFIQSRPGKKGEPFNIIKFKTMRDNITEGNSMPDRMRITKFGKILRKYSLDEIPQFINVLRGELSFIGPRPLRKYYLPLYNDFQKRRHEVKPGITGWAQVNGRNALTWEKKFELDVWYVDNVSFRLDIKIIWLTFLCVIKKENVLEPDGLYTSPFKGTGDKMITDKEVEILRINEKHL